jgi:hypothetical protein
VLAFPFGREIPQARHANAPRQPSIDCGLDQRRCEEGKRDRSINLSDTAGLPLRNLLNIRDRSSDQLFKPTSSRCDRGDQLGAGLGPYRTYVSTRCGWRQSNGLSRLFCGLLRPWNEKGGCVGISLLIAQMALAFAGFLLLGPPSGWRPALRCGHSEKLDSEVILLDVDTGDMGRD